MGLLFNLDTDTVKGPSESLYCRIDQITIQKDANRIIVSLIYFKDIEKSSRIDCISYEVLVYENGDTEGKEIRLPSTLKLDLSETSYDAVSFTTSNNTTATADLDNTAVALSIGKQF